MDTKKDQFKRMAAGQKPVGFLREFWDFLRENKKWWLVPVLVVLLLFGLLMLLGSSGIAPFIYPLF